MKYILSITDTFEGVTLEVFETKEELLEYLEENDWRLVEKVDWNNLEKYTSERAEYIAFKDDKFWRCTEVFLRVMKG